MWDIRTHAKVAAIPVFEAVEGVVALPTAVAPSAAAFPGATAVMAAAAAAAMGGGSAVKGKRCILFATAGDKGKVKIWRSDTATCVYEEVRRRCGDGMDPRGVCIHRRLLESYPEIPPPDTQAQGAGIVSGSASAEYTDLALLPGGTGLLATTADARLLFLTPSTLSPASGKGAAEGSLKLTRQLVGNNDEVWRMG